MKKKIAALLAMLMMAAAAVSCAGGGGKPSDGTGKEPGSSGGGTGSSGESTSSIDVLEPGDYNNADFTVMYRDINGSKGWGEWGVYTESDDGTVIASAVYRRNAELEDTWKIKLKYNHVNDTGVWKTDFYNQMNDSYLSGDTICDLCIPGVMDASSLVYFGFFTDLNTLDEINFDRSWWRSNINASLTLAGKQYMAIHDLLLNDVRDTFAIYFNKEVMENNEIAYPYDLVYDGKWTLDVFGKMIMGFGGEIDGDNEATIADRFGLITSINDVFFVGSGIVGASLDPETGLPVITQFSEKIAGIYDWLNKLQTTNPYDVWNYMARGDGHMQELFDKKSLFLNRSVNMLQFFTSTYESPIGVLPVPKYDEAQRHYISRAGWNGTTVLTIPENAKNKKMSADIIEAYGMLSQKYLRPAFYEKMLGARYIDDLVNDRKMLDLVIAGEVMDIDTVYQFGGPLLMKFAHNAYTGGTAASSYETYRSKAQAELDKMLANLKKQ